MAPSQSAGDCLIRARKSAAIYLLRIQEERRFAHLRDFRPSDGEPSSASSQSDEGNVRTGSRSGIIHGFDLKYPFFMSLGASRLKKRILVLVVGSWAILSLASCGGSAVK